jgi:hypothetical protein
VDAWRVFDLEPCVHVVMERTEVSRTIAFAGVVVAGMICAVASGAQTDATAIERTFQSPPPDARVMMRWWWFGPSVTQPELLRELLQMKSADIGGFEIQPVYPLALDDPQNGFRNIPYLSPAFLDDVRFVNDEARKLGLRASLTLASGWPYGGPQTPVTEAAGALHLMTTSVPAGETSVAVPAVGNGERLIGVFLAQGAWSETAAAEEKPRMLARPGAGEPRLDLPAGTEGQARTVLWFISSRTGQQVKRAAVGAEGFVLDHFSQQAVEDHLDHVADKLIAAFGDHPPYSVFSDSLEVFGSDWTPDLLAQFRARRGYDLTPYLPDLFSADPSTKAQEVRHDWGETLTELVDDNYLKTIETWARAHHTLFRSQTYGDPAVSLSSNALVDLPEGEGPQRQQFSYARWASSAAHVYGRPIVSSETWTWSHSPAFRATPLDMKAEADRFFLQGINQLMGHGWPYSPPSAGEPGWRFYASGAFNAHNPWWIVMPDVMRYMQRVSWMMRQGQPANDVAVYLPEDDAYAAFTPGHVSLTQWMPRWITPALTQTIERSGYNLDYIDSAAIEARGIHYPVLILPDVQRMPAAALARIAQYCERGGKVIALQRLPDEAPGMLDHAARSAEVSAASTRLFAHGGMEGRARLVAGSDALASALHSMLQPDMQLHSPNPAVGFIRRRLTQADIYFIANTGNVPIHTTARFRSRYRAGEWLDPDTGDARPADASGALALDLAPYESRILFLHAGAAVASDIRPSAGDSGSTVIKDLSQGWQLRFGNTGRSEAMPQLTSWTNNRKTLYYSGVAKYTRTVTLAQPIAQNARLFLAFGEGKPLTEPIAMTKQPGMRAWFDPPIRDAAIVYVNGQEAGSLWHPPYELDVTSLMKPGRNEVVVRVANTAINELAGEALPDYRLLWERYGKRFVPQGMEDLQPLPSGLLGPVMLVTRRR